MEESRKKGAGRDIAMPTSWHESGNMLKEKMKNHTLGEEHKRMGSPPE